MPFPHQHHATQIGDRLNVLAAQLKTRTRASLTDANHWLESVMTRFFNALMGWDLVNLNTEQANYPAADLGDKARRIAIQITNQDDPSKITETAAKAAEHELHKDFDRLIIFFLLPEKPSTPKKFAQPPNGPTIECWDLADLLKLMPDLPDQSRLLTALQALEKDLGLSSTGETVYPSNLPGIYSGSLFLGRDTFLRDLRASLLKKTHATAITQAPAATGIAGLGGIGKTHAAVRYALNHQADYTATLFVSGDSSDRLDAGFSALFDTLHLGPPDEVQQDQAVRIAAVKDWFTTHRDWLLIVDNVDDKAAASAFTGYLGCLTTGHVLITSRLQRWGSNVEALNIEVLSPEDSTNLLLQLTEGKRRRTDDEAAEARRLADLLEGLPLALHQAAGYISEQRLTFTSYIAEYEAEAASLLDWFESHIIPYERPDMLAPRPVLITWKTSFEKLDADTRFWLLVFAHYAPDPIPEFLLDTTPDAEDEVKTRHRAAKRALAQAETYSLLTRDPDQPRFKLHRLVQHILRLTAAEADCTIALAMGIQLFAENDLGDPDNVISWHKWTPLQSHAIALCEHSPDAPMPLGLSSLLCCLGTLLSTKSLYAQAEPFHRRALKIDEESNGSNHPLVARHLNNLAVLLQATNRMAEAEQLLRRGLQIEELSYGSDHPHVANQLNNLAQVLKRTNRLEEAESLMRRALGIDEANFGPDDPSVARDLSNLAGLLHSTNILAEAELLTRRALAIDEASFGSHHPKVAIRLSNLCVMLCETNRFEEAEPLIRRALEIDESSFGPDHPLVAARLSNLAQLLKGTNRLDEAEPLMRRALGIDEASYGPDHPNVAIRLNNLSRLLQDTNRLAEAEPLMRRAVGIAEACFGPTHPEVATKLNNLATLLRDTNRLAEAEPLMRRVLEIFEISLGKYHTKVATSLSNLAVLLQDTNRLVEAESLIWRALGIDEASYGPDHPNVAIRLNNLATLLQDTNRLVEAEPLMRRALGIFVRSLGLEYPNSQTVRGNYIRLLHTLKVPEEEIEERVLGVVSGSGG